MSTHKAEMWILRLTFAGILAFAAFGFTLGWMAA